MSDVRTRMVGILIFCMWINNVQFVLTKAGRILGKFYAMKAGEYFKVDSVEDF